MTNMDRAAILARPALAPPDGVTANFENPPNMNTLANGVLVAGIVLASLAILIRLHSWAFVLTSLRGRLEGVLVITGFLFYLGYGICLLHIANGGLGWWVHQWDVTVGDTIDFSYWVYIAGLLYNVGIASVKVAILMEWMRIFTPRDHNAFWWLCMAVISLNVAYYIAATIVEGMQCTPRALIWDPTVQGTCLNTRTVELTSSSVNVVSDLIILLTPQFVIWRLQLSRARKAGVAAIFSVGLLGFVSSIVRLKATLDYLRSNDSTYRVSAVGFWAWSEITLVFLVYGIPALPAFAASFSNQWNIYYEYWTKGTRATGSRKDSIDPNKPRSRYKRFDKNSLPLDSLDLKSFSQWESNQPRGVNHHANTPPEGGVLRTIEIQSDETSQRNAERDGEEILLRQHPWVQS
ncbi:hypothetical protein F5Y17DRAFT_435669 [Xylariaceae sp. FL0594]|nr:hypothetical protein F5Y17DRAFT_435669 [Xylariaceae sp. FL0594]